MKTKTMFLSVFLLAGCGGASSSSDELAFDAHGAREVSVDAHGAGDASPTSAWIAAGDWTMNVELPATGDVIDVHHGKFDLRETGGESFDVVFGGACKVDISSSAPPFAGTFSCTGLASVNGDTIDATGHFSISRASVASAGGDPNQSNPCKSGLPDLYCH